MSFWSRKSVVITTVTVFLSIQILYSQTQIEAFKAFRSPVNYDYKLSANFGELRGNHFHSGLDIKSSGKAIDSIFSIADGYVSRIKVAAGGYGLSVYIVHPETEFTSVYAHLEAFSEDITAVVRQNQMAFESYEIDVSLDPDALPISRGVFLGLMGNTGHSFGKHLHFELRDTRSEIPVNPLLLGFGVKDNTQPTISSVSIHGIDDLYHKVWEKNIPIPSIEATIDLPFPIYVPAFQAGIAIKTKDFMDGSRHHMGIYAMHVYVDSLLVFDYKIDKFSFDKSREITGFYDYKAQKAGKGYYYLCYKFPGCDLEFMKDSGHGFIPLNLDQEHHVRVEIEDFNHNKRTVLLTLIRDKDIVVAENTSKEGIFVSHQEDRTFQIKNLTATINKNTLFRPIYFLLDTLQNGGNNTKYKIHKRDEPLKSLLPVSLKPEHPDRIIGKEIIMFNNGTKYNLGGYWEEGALITEIPEFGIVSLEYDTIAPTIRAVKFKSNATIYRTFRFVVNDNLPVKGKHVSGIKIKVWIDGNFVISPYSLKDNVLEIPLSEINSGQHELKIEAIDHSNNKALFQASFIK
ncbi:MAG: M23 family metallopeptidase [Saprospiraceae bacterium]|nr:MAG: peptidase M23 [Bacteroidetes bacterium OLB9]MCO6464851.1 M23 family metallopeptidase [Saprospiraceae bacterium]